MSNNNDREFTHCEDGHSFAECYRIAGVKGSLAATADLFASLAARLHLKPNQEDRVRWLARRDAERIIAILDGDYTKAGKITEDSLRFLAAEEERKGANVH